MFLRPLTQGHLQRRWRRWRSVEGCLFRRFGWEIGDLCLGAFALFPGQTSKHSENVNIMSVELIAACFDWL